MPSPFEIISMLVISSHDRLYCNSDEKAEIRTTKH
jgi:hypothetical protein